MTTNDNLRGLLAQARLGIKTLKLMLPRTKQQTADFMTDELIACIDAALAEPDSGEVVSRQRPNCGCDVHVESCEVCRAAMGKAEPPTRHWDDCPACTGVGYCVECTPEPGDPA